MKQRLLLLGICLYLATALSAVAVPYIATELPFACGRADKGTYGATYSFWRVYGCWGIPDEFYLGWKNARLDPNTYENQVDFWTDRRGFRQGREKFKIATFCFGFDMLKTLLYTSKDDGYYIDVLTVGASFVGRDYFKKNDYTFYDFLQYEITTDLQVIVYQLYPISDAPLDGSDLWYFDFTNGMRAQRVDRVYQIDKDGYFHQVSETRYMPQTYTAYQMLNTYYNIWDGYETVQWWYEPDFAYRPPYRTVW